MAKLKLLKIALCFCLIGCQPYPFQKEIKTQVIEVVDGDTIMITGGKLVRYIGIDAPEKRKQIGKEWIEVNEPFAQEAKLLNEELLIDKEIRLEFDVERIDKYGRLLAYCFVDNIFVNERLLTDGLGLLYTRAPNVKYADILASAQKIARRDKKGLWQDELYVDAEHAGRFIGKVATVTGRVLKVGESKDVVYLNFGRDYRSDFTVVIFRKDLPSFLASGINPKNYMGKIIRVFGKIKEYNGPEIIARHPSQIEIIE